MDKENYNIYMCACVCIYVYIHTHNGILVIQKSEILQVATICIMLSEICQTVRKTNMVCYKLHVEYKK